MNNDYQISLNNPYFVQSANPSRLLHLWYVIALCAIINRRVFTSKTDEIELPQNAGVRVTRILDARVCSGYGGTLWFRQDPSHVYCLVSTRLFSFIQRLLSYVHEGKVLLPERESGSVVPNIEPHLFRSLKLMLQRSMEHNVYMMMFISSFCDDASSLVRFARVWGFIASSASKDSLERSFSCYGSYPIHLIVMFFT